MVLPCLKRRDLKTAFLQALIIDGKSISLPNKDLYMGASGVEEQVHVATQWFFS